MAFNNAAPVTLSSCRNASLFWIMSWLISAPTDHGMILAGLAVIRPPVIGLTQVVGLNDASRDRFEIDAEKFESFQGSQPERSLLHCFRMCENRRHFRGLGHDRPVSSDGFSGFPVQTRGFDAPVSARDFPISVSARGRPVRQWAETGSQNEI